MSPTIFDASRTEETAKRERLEKELEEQKRRAMSRETSTLPAREEKREEKSEQPLPSEEITETILMHTTPSETHKSEDKNEDEKIGRRRKRDPKEYSELIRSKRATRNPFAAFAVRPPGAYFASQHHEEQVLMVLRQHPIVNLRWILIAFVMILVPYTVLPLIPVFDVVPGRFQFFAFIGWYLLTLAFIVENFLYWYFNIYVITDERIVDIDFYSLIHRSISSAKIENIEDTTATTKGVLGSVFNFGDVNIQTAAEQREFEFLKVPQPATVTKFINELILEEEREKLEGRVM